MSRNHNPISGAARASRQGTNRYCAPDPERCGLLKTGGLAGSNPAAADCSLRREVSIGAGAGSRCTPRLDAARPTFRYLPQRECRSRQDSARAHSLSGSDRDALMHGFSHASGGRICPLSGGTAVMSPGVICGNGEVMARKFAVGDRVKVISRRHGSIMWFGRIGYIARVYQGYYVRFGRSRNKIWFEGVELEAAPAKTRKKRKAK